MVYPGKTFFFKTTVLSDEDYTVLYPKVNINIRENLRLLKLNLNIFLFNPQHLLFLVTVLFLVLRNHSKNEHLNMSFKLHFIIFYSLLGMELFLPLTAYLSY